MRSGVAPFAILIRNAESASGPPACPPAVAASTPRQDSVIIVSRLYRELLGLRDKPGSSFDVRNIMTCEVKREVIPLQTTVATYSSLRSHSSAS